MFFPRNYVVALFLFAACITCWHCSPGSNKANHPPIFELLDANTTGIDFINTIENGPKTNIFMYEYFFNGAGVAVGDLNGDGLEDLYFTANMESNRLYLNKGDFKFEDITEASGAAGRKGPWKTGVSIVDINGDGRLDIHVAYSGILSEQRLYGQLFINRGNNEQGLPQFTDMALEAGLGFAVQCHQAYFFDYDRDGDLDLLLLNHNRKPLPPMDEVTIQSMLQQKDPVQGMRLLRNDPTNEGLPQFTDVTEKAGISTSPLSYGLGAAIADIDGDGWEDIYICNDYLAPDYLYINTGKGTFENKLREKMAHTSHFSMGSDVADINNDGLPDIFTLDMLPEDNRRQKLLLSLENYEAYELNVRSGLHHQYMRNMLHLNTGNGRFAEVGQLAGISNTDWSWAPLFADFDNDGFKDLYITNGYLRDFTNQDFVKYVGNSMGRAQGRLSEQMILDLVEKMPASDVSNYLFRNGGNLTFANQTDAWGLQRPSNSNGAVWADLDNDGDLDLVVNNINQPAFVYRNRSAEQKTANGYLKIYLKGQGLNTQGIGAAVRVYAGGMQQWLHQMPFRGYLSSVSSVLHAGLGLYPMADSVVVYWPSGKVQSVLGVAANQTLFLEEAAAGHRSLLPAAVVMPLFTAMAPPISWQHINGSYNDFKRQPLMVQAQSITGPCMAFADINGDGLDDWYLGGGEGQAGALYLGNNGGGFKPMVVAALDADKWYADTDAQWLDANGDGWLDLYVGSGGYHQFAANDSLLQDRLYWGDGKGGLVRATDALPAMRTSTGCVRVADVNGDGHPDLFVGGRVVPGRYPEAPENYLLINDGTGRYRNAIEQMAPALHRIGMVTDAQWADLDGNGQPELLVCGEWMAIKVFAPEGPQWKDHSTKYFEKPLTGFWNRLLVHDFNGDGRPDIVAGNLGLNSQIRVYPSLPATLHYKDFDLNGSIDPIFGFAIQGKNYPYITRDELLDQMTMMRSRFGDYQSYAEATIKEIFYAEELEGAQRLEINTLETVWLEQQANGRYVLKPLPVEAQMAPVHALVVLDANNDGRADLLLLGNTSKARLRLGKMDANAGLLLLANETGGFSVMPAKQTGLYMYNDVRAAALKGDTLITGIHNGALRWHKLNRP